MRRNNNIVGFGLVNLCGPCKMKASYLASYLNLPPVFSNNLFLTLPAMHSMASLHSGLSGPGLLNVRSECSPFPYPRTVSASTGVASTASAYQSYACAPVSSRPRNNPLIVRTNAASSSSSTPSPSPVKYFYREPSQWPTAEEIKLKQHDLEQQPYVDLIIAGAGPSGIVVAERVAQV